MTEVIFSLVNKPFEIQVYKLYYLSSGPEQLNPNGRSDDLGAILDLIPAKNT
jgi:hypothetical protein